MSRTVGYTRGAKADSPLGPGLELIQSKGYPDTDGWYVDPPTKRTPAFNRLLSAIRPSQLVYIGQLAREFNSAWDLAGKFSLLRKRRAGLYLAEYGCSTFDEAGMMFMAGIEAAATMIRRRREEVLAGLRAKGLPAGKIPYGFKKHMAHGKAVLIQDAEARNVGKHFVLWRQEGWSLEAIVRHARKLELRDQYGKAWHRYTVREAIRNELALQRLEAKETQV